MKLERTVAPTELAVPLETAKEHIVVDHHDDDMLIEGYIRQATAYCERQLNHHIGAQEWMVYGDSWAEIQALPVYPLHSVVVTYDDEDGAEQTLAADQYFLDNKSFPARIMPATDVTWPDLGDGFNTVRVTCQTGHTETSDAARTAILLLVGHYYENREASSPVAIHTVPMAVDAAIDSEKLVVM